MNEEELVVGDNIEDGELEEELLEDISYDEQELRAIPYRIMLMFTGADEGDDTLDEVIEEIINEANSRGLFFEFAMGTEMDLSDVIQGSPLHQAITGQEDPL